MNALALYTIFRSPLDHPGWFVCRRHFVPGGFEPLIYSKALTLAVVRSKLPPGLYNLGRQADDDPAIVETWV